MTLGERFIQMGDWRLAEIEGSFSISHKPPGR